MTGFLLIDKPAGITSHGVVNRVRRLTNEKRVGHAGTLDPFATGLLLVGVTRTATREMQNLSGLDKKYVAEFTLGARTETDDTEGEREPAPLNTIPTLESLEETLVSFRGEIEQLPPTYSAIKIGGKKMYEAARQGKPLEAKPRSVTIYSYTLSDLQDRGNGIYTVTAHIHCSTGTYIRSLARDLGIALGGGGFASQLRRTAIGPFSIEDAHTLEALEGTVEEALVPVESILAAL